MLYGLILIKRLATDLNLEVSVTFIIVVQDPLDLVCMWLELNPV